MGVSESVALGWLQRVRCPAADTAGGDGDRATRWVSLAFNAHDSGQAPSSSASLKTSKKGKTPVPSVAGGEPSKKRHVASVPESSTRETKRPRRARAERVPGKSKITAPAQVDHDAPRVAEDVAIDAGTAGAPAAPSAATCSTVGVTDAEAEAAAVEKQAAKLVKDMLRVDLDPVNVSALFGEGEVFTRSLAAVKGTLKADGRDSPHFERDGGAVLTTVASLFRVRQQGGVPAAAEAAFNRYLAFLVDTYHAQFKLASAGRMWTRKHVQSVFSRHPDADWVHVGGGQLGKDLPDVTTSSRRRILVDLAFTADTMRVADQRGWECVTADASRIFASTWHNTLGLNGSMVVVFDGCCYHPAFLQGVIPLLFQSDVQSMHAYVVQLASQMHGAGNLDEGTFAVGGNNFVEVQIERGQLKEKMDGLDAWHVVRSPPVPDRTTPAFSTAVRGTQSPPLRRSFTTYKMWCKTDGDTTAYTGSTNMDMLSRIVTWPHRCLSDAYKIEIEVTDVDDGRHSRAYVVLVQQMLEQERLQATLEAAIAGDYSITNRTLVTAVPLWPFSNSTMVCLCRRLP